MEIFIHTIQKGSDVFRDSIEEYIKMSKKYAKISDNIYFNDKIAKAQSKSKEDAHLAYDNLYFSKINGFCVGLDEKGKKLNSFEFAKILEKSSKISFFIGGAYGLSENFKLKMDMLISLSSLTFAHKIAKIVLYEQIYRGFCINANHPYHK
ncbi:23S rRNA (pseudouridine(1915)-N(3))-methyltransferase RlmH [Campylobacter sp. FMV-PI01]|uniref:Ribosomal RNA large subunit methyltransferase H n=1 Tax=Campylobacter portucalensis TaxID=2608384 RepID=A0A6L5WJN1_9BACT|nr:23S rRNA (pseudouridine(1915)-N(3))-methyltransferase RlmH [Campylobacter portucalensis]MSN96652.1 23S rRNA (pseudouridine(1915)-N(3))-methyltransferase RlmH [Campylobacter portucalensis]